LMGGVLTSTFGWHSIFTVNVPLALLTVLLVLLWIPKDQPRAASSARLMGRVGPDWHRAFYDLPFEPDGFPDES
jgi:predicted MFS family arabinose efflux permease